MKINEDKGIKRLRWKLSADEGFAERPIYTIKAFNTEKDKGIDMVELLENNFSISEKDKQEKKQREIQETKNEIDKRKDFIKAIQEPVKWTRDEEGNIISPFSNKK